jgi:hypothetical protein
MNTVLRLEMFSMARSFILKGSTGGRKDAATGGRNGGDGKEGKEGKDGKEVRTAGKGGRKGRVEGR